MSSHETRERLLRLVRERAFRQGEFTLSSGEKSDYYIDGRMIEVHPEGATLIGEAIYDRIKGLDADAVGGLAVAAVPLVTSTVISCFRHGRPIEGFWVRQEVKEHGTKKLIEGKLPEKAKVVIVDDVITSGDSVQKAINAVEAAGAKVVAIVTLVDRQRGARELFEKAGYFYDPLFTKDELFVKEYAG
jgi:orotate phosphoribosyltransferase